MLVQPYLFFEGRCEEAIEFYVKALGAKVEMMMRFKESPDRPSRHGTARLREQDHACEFSHRRHDGDGAPMVDAQGKPNFGGFSLSLTVPNEAEAERLFAALAEGGQIRMPLTKTFFSSHFGMVTDRFGVGWMVYVPAAAWSEELGPLSRRGARLR